MQTDVRFITLVYVVTMNKYCIFVRALYKITKVNETVKISKAKKFFVCCAIFEHYYVLS